MLSLPIGMLMMLATIYLAIDVNTWPLFLNVHALIVVVFGTLAVLVLATPSRVLVNLFHAIQGLFRRTYTIADHWREFEELSRHRTLKTPSKNLLIDAAIALWESGVSNDLFIVLLSQKRSELEVAHADAVQAIRNLAKYPPAMGMLGTVVGLVSLFSNLGVNGKGALGPALALAMTATFFGLLLANALIMPLADRLHVQHLSQKRIYTEVYQVLLLINRGESLDLIDDQRSSTKAA